MGYEPIEKIIKSNIVNKSNYHKLKSDIIIASIYSNNYKKFSSRLINQKFMITLLNETHLEKALVYRIRLNCTHILSATSLSSGNEVHG